MKNKKQKLNVVITHGIDDELSSVGFTVANGGLDNGLDTSVFLTSTGVDLVRKRATDTTLVEPFKPLKTLIQRFLDEGGTIWACTPCVKGRGYEQDDLLDGVIIIGATPMLLQIKEGSTALSF